ncbi:reverse transcriptase domain-containing protein [Tanacetum coccineum]
MSDMIALLNDLSNKPPNEQNEPTQEDIGETSNEPTQAKRNEFEELYGDNNKDVQFCPVCKTSRWKDSNTLGKKVPKKVLRYFLIIPRLQSLYKSSHTAKKKTWHATGKCTEPGKMQHPVDGRAWKNFDTKYLNFAKEPRNVRLGFPFGNLSQAYSMWPVILTTYNLPPWLCMKESSFMLTLLILGPKSPGKDIDVYLRPMIDD